MQLIETARTRPIDVPDAAGAEDVQFVPSDVRIFPEAPGLVIPVPPLPAGKVPVTPVDNGMLVIVLLAPLIVLFVTVLVLLLVNTLVGVMMLDKVAIIYSGLAGQVTSQGKPA
jgi:hypothetical protein